MVDEQDPDDLRPLFVRVFSNPDGKAFLKWMDQRYGSRRRAGVSSSTTPIELAYGEGQRSVLSTILSYLEVEL